MDNRKNVKDTLVSASIKSRQPITASSVTAIYEPNIKAGAEMNE